MTDNKVPVLASLDVDSVIKPLTTLPYGGASFAGTTEQTKLAVPVDKEKPISPRAGTLPTGMGAANKTIASDNPEGSQVTARNGSIKDVRAMNPALREKYLKLEEAAKAEGMELKLESVYRSAEYQEYLYKTRKGVASGVKPARGGKSRHNAVDSQGRPSSKAVDVAIIQNGKKLPSGHPAYKRLGQLGKGVGLQWGGDFWNNYDPVHFQI